MKNSTGSSFFEGEIKKALSFSIFTSSVWGKSEKVFCLIGYSSLFPKEILSDLFPFSLFLVASAQGAFYINSFFRAHSSLFPTFLGWGKKRRTFA